MELFSQGLCSAHNLQDINIYQNESRITSYINKNDVNATVQIFKACVELESSEMLNWKELIDKDMFGRFSKEGAIYIREFRRLSMLVPFSEIQMLQHVRKLGVSDCDSLVEVFGSAGEFTKRGVATHYHLQKMTLEYLPRLSRIWKHNIAEFVNFQNLTEIEVSDCRNLRSLLSHSMARSLVQLQRIEVVRCSMMEEIITMEGEPIEGGNKVKTLFPKLEELILLYLPKLKCVCSGDYDYDIPLCTVEVDKEFNNNDKVQISFPQLKVLCLREVPELKCFCSGTYDYDIMVSSTNECPNMTTFPHGNVIVHTPSLHELEWNWSDIYTLEDLNLTIYYLQNSQKYQVELQKLETFRDMNEELIGYIKRVKKFVILYRHKLWNCIPSNLMQLFSHVKSLTVKECEFLEKIFESNDSMLQCKLEALELFSLPKLKLLWKNHGQIIGFEWLRHIMIEQCNNLEYVLPDVSVVTSLPSLVSIHVFECEKMKEIIGNNCVQQKAKIKFPSLWEITLTMLPSLKWFSQSSFPCYVDMPQCFKIRIEDCPKMKTFWYEGILYTPRLYRIYVENTKFDKDEDVNEVIQRQNK